MKPVILFTFKDRQIWRICFIAISLLLAFLIADSVFADPKKGKTVISDLKKEPAAQAAAIDNDLQVGDLVH